jgi:hypothetical protein
LALARWNGVAEGVNARENERSATPFLFSKGNLPMQTASPRLSGMTGFTVVWVSQIISCACLVYDEFCPDDLGV